MAYSKITVPGDGVTTLFPVNFALGIDPGQFTCRVGNEVDGAGNPAYRTVTRQLSGLYQVSGPPVAVGTNLVFERTVTKTQLIVDWEDGDAITKTNLNKAQKQAIFIGHEALDKHAELVGNLGSAAYENKELFALASDLEAIASLVEAQIPLSTYEFNKGLGDSNVVLPEDYHTIAYVFMAGLRLNEDEWTAEGDRVVSFDPITADDLGDRTSIKVVVGAGTESIGTYNIVSGGVY